MSRQGLFRRARATIAVVVVAGLSVSCSSAATPPAPAKPANVTSAFTTADPAPALSSAVRKIGPAGGHVDLGGVVLTVPAGAVAAGSSITVQSGKPMTNGGEHFGEPVSVGHQQPLATPIEIRWPAAAVPAGDRDSLILVRWNPELRAWAASTEPITEDGDTLVAHVSEFSIVDWENISADWEQAALKLAGKRVDAPSCSGKDLPDWVTNVVDTDEGFAAAAIRVCFEPDKNDVLTVRTANNRAIAQKLVLDEDADPWAWTWYGTEDFSPAVVPYLAARVLDSSHSMLMPPLTATAAGVSRPSTPGLQAQQATTKIDGVTVAADVLSMAFDAMPIGGTGNPLLNVFLQVMYECGGKQLLKQPGTKADAMARAVVSTLNDCAGEILRPESEFGALFEKLSRAAIAKGGTSATNAVKANRLIRQVSSKLAVLKYFDITIYVKDQLTAAVVGPLSWGVSGRGLPQDLGQWKPTCSNTKTDSNRLYKNLALQDQFSDTSKELWQFKNWTSAAARAVKPLSTCSVSYLNSLATKLPSGWGDQKAARIVADEIRKIVALKPIVVDGTTLLPVRALPASEVDRMMTILFEARDGGDFAQNADPCESVDVLGWNGDDGDIDAFVNISAECGGDTANDFVMVRNQKVVKDLFVCGDCEGDQPDRDSFFAVRDAMKGRSLTHVTWTGTRWVAAKTTW